MFSEAVLWTFPDQEGDDAILACNIVSQTQLSRVHYELCTPVITHSLMRCYDAKIECHRFLKSNVRLAFWLPVVVAVIVIASPGEG